jgi:hypothetical protein
MAKPKAKQVKRKEAESVEVEPDAWERFESAIKKVVPPKRGEPGKNKTAKQENE